MAIKYNKYQKDLRETYKNLYKDIEEHPDPDRMGPVPIVTWTPIRALLAVPLDCRPLFFPGPGRDHLPLIEDSKVSKVSRGQGQTR